MVHGCTDQRLWLGVKLTISMKFGTFQFQNLSTAKTIRLFSTIVCYHKPFGLKARPVKLYLFLQTKLHIIMSGLINRANNQNDKRHLPAVPKPFLSTSGQPPSKFLHIPF